jgi:hypothetical protein
MSANAEERLIQKLRKIETLFARAATPGERTAAGGALDRIRQRLLELEREEPAIEYRFTLADGWSKSLFISLLQRYGLTPYRYRGQRRTTVMAKVTVSFVDEVLWPEFTALNDTLREHLESVTARVIQEAIYSGRAELEEREEVAPAQTSRPGAVLENQP